MFSWSIAHENLRIIDIKSAAMGFVSDKMSSFHENKKISIDSMYTEWFSTGLRYNSNQVNFFLPWINLSLGLESLSDHDDFDYFGYGIETTFLRVGLPVRNFFRVETSLRCEQFLLESNAIGNGLVNYLGIETEPINCRFGDIHFGIGMGRAQRKYKTGRVETEALPTEFICRLKSNVTNIAISVDREETHLGGEFYLTNNIALRAGLNGAEPTFGLGINFKRLELNYAHWLAEAGATQLFGMSLSF